MALNFLTDNDVKIIQRLIDKEKRGPNVRTRSADEEGEDYLAPEVYIAKPYADIPAAYRSGDECIGESETDALGIGTCQIYKVVVSATDSGLFDLEAVTGFTKTVYNLTTSSISSSTWVKVIRDKYGSWIADPFNYTRRFMLAEALIPGESACAYLVDFEGTVDDTVSFEVDDFFEIHRGRGQDQYASPHDRGNWGMAMFQPDTGTYEIVYMREHALMIKGTASADWSSSTLALTAASVKVLQPIGAFITDQDPNSNITVYDTMGFTGSANDLCYAVWNEGHDPAPLVARWELIQKGCS